MCTLFHFWESQCGGELGQLHKENNMKYKFTYLHNGLTVL